MKKTVLNVLLLLMSCLNNESMVVVVPYLEMYSIDVNFLVKSPILKDTLFGMVPYVKFRCSLSTVTDAEHRKCILNLLLRRLSVMQTHE